MRNILILISLIALAGCTVDNSDLVQHSYTDEQTDSNTGLVLQPSANMWVSFPEMVNIYLATETCMGMTARPAPTVAFKSFSEQRIGGVWGFYHAGEQVVWINADENLAPRSQQTDTETLQHEFIHHILYANDSPYHDGESPELFQKCGIGVNTYN